MINNRSKKVVVVSQFNINGSRGQDAGKFVADYVSRDSATEKSSAYIPNPNVVPVVGDGVAFTLDNIAITRDETLRLADHIQDLHLTGKRAIQQMVISFEPDYLVEQKIVPDDTVIINKGDYRHNYDDVRLRHAVRSGLQTLIDDEGYRDGRAVACIQWDTRHLHVHAVVYEDASKIARMRGSEEKGVIKDSSFNHMVYDIDRHLSITRAPGLVPTDKRLIPNIVPVVKKPVVVAPEPFYVNQYLMIIEEQKRIREAALQHEKDIQDMQEDEREQSMDETTNDVRHVVQRVIDEYGNIEDITNANNEQTNKDL